jgi:hypothetical protein
MNLTQLFYGWKFIYSTFLLILFLDYDHVELGDWNGDEVNY